MKYRKEVDGLRAVAVVPVILYHAGWSFFSGGYVGVDIFFVISGFLITSIILDEIRSGTFSYRRFYARRARRLLPALCAVLLFCIPVALALLGPQALDSFAKGLVAVFTMTANILFWKQTDYFAADAGLNPILHFWSLSVEEQYYVVFPIVCVFLHKMAQKSFTAILLAALIASFVLAEWATHTHASVAFYFLPTRSWELLLGALLATPKLTQFCAEFSSRRKAAAQFLGVFGIVLILYSIAIYNKATPFPGVYALVPTIGSVLILAFARQGSLAAKVLGWKPFVGIGLISYSAYLWHQPILTFSEIFHGEKLPFQYTSVLVPLCLIVAYFSWRFVEVPLRKPSSRGALAQAFVLIPIPLIVAVGIAGVATHGFEHFIYTRRFNDTQRVLYDAMKEQTAGIALHSDGECRFAVDRVSDSLQTQFAKCFERYGAGNIIIGDSHALNIYNAMYVSDSTKFFVGIMHVGCRPDTKDQDCPYASLRQFVQNNRAKIGRIFYHQSGAHLLQDDKGFQDTDDIFAPERMFSFDFPAINATMAYLDTLSASVPVVWLGPYVEARVNLQALKSMDSARIRPRVQTIFTQLDSVLKSRHGTETRSWRYVSLVDILAIDSQFLWLNGCLTFRDTDHLSVCGEEIVGERLKKHAIGMTTSYLPSR
ncbi:MAG: acyltransferase family protein [Gemmatimonas sp.]